MAKSSYRPFTPKPEQVALIPEISGNEINGLGETERRKPSKVYWHDPDSLAHGEMQKWFYTQNADDPHVIKARENRQAILDLEVPPITGKPLQQSAQAWTSELRDHVDTLDMELFGITPFRPEWAFEGIEITRKWMIMIGVAHAYDEIKLAPQLRAGAEVVHQYGRGMKSAKDIATWIRRRGWDADPHSGPLAGPMVLIPAAIECGFGELGKHGSMINEEYGSSFRIACVLTDIPLISTEQESYNVDDFCSRCQVCANACPPDAILPAKAMVRGDLKWYVDFDKCIPFFNENAGCAICIAVCPWSIPGKGPRIIEQLQRRAEKQKSA
ncbi:MAG: 4Fe-4S dicluster domain-containing protein [Woeseiaceae bacterium]|nr:4Fe-4S dicluster domain-containing protein [Woeseiaceae bacterium]